MKKLLFLCTVFVAAVITWLWVLQPTSQSFAGDSTTMTQTTANQASEHKNMSSVQPVQSTAPAAEASQASIADQTLINTKSDSNVQPIDPDTDPANQSVKVN